jgi:hypothetical protein
MTERDFWDSLEYRLCQEFAGLPERRHQSFWCDGFLPQEYFLDDCPPRITGKVWICDGPKQKLWQFVLILRTTVTQREEIDWAAILPEVNVTKWMSFDEDACYLEIEPAVAVPDFEPIKRKHSS